MLAKFGVRAGPGARSADADRRRRRQRAGRAEGRTEDRGQVARAVRDARQRHRARRRDRRRRRREPARGARLAAAGQQAADGQDRLRRCRSRRPISCVAPPTRAKLQRAVRALRVQELAARTSDDGAPRSRPTPIARRARTRGRRVDASADGPPRRAPPVPRHYETVLDEAALERWLDAIERAELVCFDTETTSLDPMQARIVGLSFAIEPGHARATFRSRTATRARPTSCRSTHVLARLTPWFDNPAREKARPERQVRPARARQSRPRARRRRARHAARSRTCSSRTGRTTWTISRGAIST